MKLCDINPFMRYAELQPSVMSNASLYCAYDHRIFYILEGSANFVLADRTVPLSKGMLIYFRPCTPYYFDGKVKVIVLNFDITRDHSDKKSPRPPSKKLEDFDKNKVFENDPPEELKDISIIEKAFYVENKIREILLHYCYPTKFSDAITSAILKDLLCYIAQSTVQKERKFPEIVQNAMLYIRQNYDKNISNSQISGEIGYHPFYLNRVFKSNTGLTIHQAVIEERMRIAKKILKETDLSVNEIAMEVGYSDHTHFCAAFKKHTGITPLEYRSRAKP